MQQYATAIVTEFAQLSRRVDGEPVEQLLPDVVDLVLTHVPGSDWAGLLDIPRPGFLGRRAVSGPAFDHLTAEQVATHSGPCLDAVTRQRIVVVDDLTTDTRWPDFAAAALSRTQIRSTLSVPVSDSMVLTACARTPGALDAPSALLPAVLLAQLTGMLLRHVAVERRASQLVDGLEGARTIGVAQGVLMQRHGLDDRAATELLYALASDASVSLPDVAAYVALTANLPAGARLGDGRDGDSTAH